MRCRAALLTLVVAAAVAPCACDALSEEARQASMKNGDSDKGWRRLQQQATRLEQRALMFLRSDYATVSPTQKSNGVRSPGASGAGADPERLRAAALELRGRLEAVESANERALPEIRREVSKLEAAVVQAQARAAHADEAQEGTRRWLRAVISAYGRRAARDRRLLLRLGRALAAAARSRARARTLRFG